MKKTLIAFVLDKSQSMQQFGRKPEEVVKTTLNSIIERSRIEGLISLVSLVQFNHEVTVVYPPTLADRAPPFVYSAHGDTALWDAVGKAIDVLKTDPYSSDPDTAFLVIVVTDGENNISRFLDAHSASKLIKELQLSGKWTFAFNVPKQRDWGPPSYADRLAQQSGIPRDNIREWETTESGLKETGEANRIGTQSYLAARSQGHTSVEHIYKVNTDLSQVTKADLSKLVDVSSRFKLVPVPKEEAIRPFVESTLNRPYIIGGTYYQLTKKEKVQGNKEVLAKEKSGKRIFGGPEARDLLGLPKDGSLSIVVPGNHANYDIFVQSRTVNRKLVRGTKVAIDTHKQVSDSPTWDHTNGGKIV